ncbi:amino acid ABC transporter permease [Candidatus Microgenomates bacterium]|nr:amino acid ABC transporter permease [Candidatus Microgenomates bacterium]
MKLDTSIYLLDWLFILKGAGITLFLCLNAMVFGSILGLIIGTMRTSKLSILKYISGAYIYIIRGTPLLMQLFLVYYGLPVFFRIIVSAYTTALVGLTVYAAAYLAEIVKAGLQSVDKGQKDAAKALGMTSWQEFRSIVLPQALKVIVPPAFGFFIALIKDSSLVAIIGFIELTRSSRMVISRTYQPFTIYLGVAVIYFVICYGLSIISQKYFKANRQDIPKASQPWKTVAIKVS